MATALERAAATATVIDATKERRAKLSENLTSLFGVRESLLPVESGARDRIDQEIAGMEVEIECIDFAAETGLPRLSLEPFFWRNRKGFPILAPFGVMGSEIRILTHFRASDSSSWVRHKITDFIPAHGEALYRRIYPDVIARMNKKVRETGDRASLSASFEGIIPDETREKIQQWPAKDVFLVTEVPDWRFGVTKAPRVDPLVCLWRHDTLWLLDKFDTTSIEEYIAREFTT